MPMLDGAELGLALNSNLALQRCPHCSTANPTISFRAHVVSKPGKAVHIAAAGGMNVIWSVYVCESCAGLVAAAGLHPQTIPSLTLGLAAKWVVPTIQSVSPDIPPQAARYLAQARETLSSPDSSVMTSASAVDAMLKGRNYMSGTLYSRIKQAETDGVLTKDMAQWAHDIRLDANDERHADLAHSGATASDAIRCFEFADALADLLFVLPARVKRGLRPLTQASKT
jgi:Domain of unknown function (DUF4145)